ncbi:unnamed protein product, partial [Discosporangium mesarthrocarpum]
EWIFKAYAEIIEQEPQLFLQDTGLAMTEAAHVVFPNANALWCRFHVQQNLKKRP